MNPMGLEDHIDRLRRALREGRFTSEAAVSQGAVLPTLNALGWPVFDTGVLRWRSTSRFRSVPPREQACGVR